THRRQLSRKRFFRRCRPTRSMQLCWPAKRSKQKSLPHLATALPLAGSRWLRRADGSRRGPLGPRTCTKSMPRVSLTKSTWSSSSRKPRSSYCAYGPRAAYVPGVSIEPGQLVDSGHAHTAPLRGQGAPNLTRRSGFEIGNHSQRFFHRLPQLGNYALFEPWVTSHPNRAAPTWMWQRKEPRAIFGKRFDSLRQRSFS